VDCAIDDSIDEQGWWGGRPQESDQEVADRAERVTRRLIDTFASTQQNVVAVIHADFKRCLLRRMLGGTANPDSFGPLRNTGISKLNYDGERWQLDWLNSVSHLPARLITGNEH
jgi:2,3-bisphosphoglycerate-dependent phosphoglycerate mutase